MIEELTTVEQVVRALGGNRAVATITRAKNTSAVSNWKKAGIFPGKVHRVMKNALIERSYTAPDTLWRIVHD
jgi:predicted SpoU family rRNA methylase